MEFIKKTGKVFYGIIPMMFLMSSRGYADYIYNGIEFVPSASVQESYDSNVTYVKNHPISDAITQLLAGLDIKQETKTQSLSVDTKIEEELFAQHSSFDNTSEYLNLLFHKDFSEVDQLKVTDAFSHAEDPTSFQNAFGSTAGRFYTYQNDLGLNFRHDLTEQLAVDFDYANSLLDFSNSESNSTLNTVGTGLEYSLDSATILKTNYDYMYRDFYPGSSATENELSAGLRRYLTSQLYMDLSSGADIIDSFDGKEYVKPLYKAGLTQDLDENTQTGISYERQYTTTGYTQDMFNAWRVSGNYIKDLTSRLTATFNVFYGAGDYVSIGDKLKYTGASIGLSYDLTKNSHLNLSYTFSQEDSNVQSDIYTKNVVFLGVKINL